MLIERSITGSPDVPFTPQLIDRRRDHIVEMRANRLRVDGVGTKVLAPDLGDLRLGDERAEGGGQSGIDRNDHLGHPHLGGDVGGVKRPSAAEGDERIFPGIETAIDGEDPDGVGHVLVGDVDDRLRDLHAPHAEAIAQLVELRLGLRHVQLNRRRLGNTRG